MRGSASRGINRGSITFTRPVFPSPTPPGWNRRRFGFPLSFAPHRHRQRTSGAGTGHRARTWNNALLTSAEPPILRVHSMRATSRRTANGRGAANARADTRFHFRTGITSVVRAAPHVRKQSRLQPTTGPRSWPLRTRCSHAPRRLRDRDHGEAAARPLGEPAHAAGRGHKRATGEDRSTPDACFRQSTSRHP